MLWREANERELMEHILFDDVPPLSQHVAVPPELEAIVARACARSIEQRFASAREMSAAIESAGLPLATYGEVGELVQSLFAESLSVLHDARELARACRLRSPLGVAAVIVAPGYLADDQNLGASAVAMGLTLPFSSPSPCVKT